MVLRIPNITDDMATATAAIHYANAGWYVLPVRAGKHPGSVVGNEWQTKSSSKAGEVAAWFAGTDYAIALHVGRSGAVAFDVDTPSELHPELAELLKTTPVYQSTRDDQPERGHYLFAQPAGRKIGNSVSTTELARRYGSAWGDIRGDVGVIIVAPSAHSKGGHYRWQATGELPVLPAELASLLPDRDDRPAGSVNSAAAAAWLAGLPTGQRCKPVDGAFIRLAKACTRQLGNAHDAANESLLNLLRVGDQGHPGVAGCLEPMRQLFVQTVSDRASAVEAADEWDRMVDGAIGFMGDSSGRPDVDPCVQHVEDTNWLLGNVPHNKVALLVDTTTGTVDVVKSGLSGLPTPAVRRLKTVTASQVVDTAVEWLWAPDGQNWLPAGELAICAGRGGVGKSSFTLWVAAQVTHGLLAGRHEGTPGEVLVYATEDGFGIQKARLLAAGADMDRVHLLEGTIYSDDQDEDASEPVWTQDMPLIRQMILERGIRLLIVDPIANVVSGDSHNDKEVKRALKPFASVAHATGATVLGVAHFKKGVVGSGVDDLINGSTAFSDSARAVIGFASNKKTSENVMRLIKHSYSTDHPDRQYGIELASATSAVPAFRPWGLAVGTFEDALKSGIISNGKSDDIEADERLQWLAEFLADGDKTSSQCEAEALHQPGKYKWDTVTRWIKSAGGREVFDKAPTGPGTPWLWKLTDHGRKLYGC